VTEHKATIVWERGDSPFTYKEYPRSHVWKFEDGEVQASAAPKFFGDPSLVDPEEAFVASLSSCHMLTFLAVASKAGFVLDRYEDAAVGFLERNEERRLAITRVSLRPRIQWNGESPTAEELDELHRQAHEHCFIANSVRTQIEVAPPPSESGAQLGRESALPKRAPQVNDPSS
jgi:organic hydroperoxide reductase OsmC/OhrA